MESFGEVRRRVRNAALRSYEICVFAVLLVGAIELLPGALTAGDPEGDAAEMPAVPPMPHQCGNAQTSADVITR